MRTGLGASVCEKASSSGRRLGSSVMAARRPHDPTRVKLADGSSLRDRARGMRPGGHSTWVRRGKKFRFDVLQPVRRGCPPLQRSQTLPTAPASTQQAKATNSMFAQVTLPPAALNARAATVRPSRQAVKPMALFGLFGGGRTATASSAAATKAEVRHGRCCAVALHRMAAACKFRNLPSRFWAHGTNARHPGSLQRLRGRPPTASPPPARALEPPCLHAPCIPSTSAHHFLSVIHSLASPLPSPLPSGTQLLEAIKPLKRGLAASEEDQARVEKLAAALEQKNPTKKPLASDLINGGQGRERVCQQAGGRAGGQGWEVYAWEVYG